MLDSVCTVVALFPHSTELIPAWTEESKEVCALCLLHPRALPAAVCCAAVPPARPSGLAREAIAAFRWFLVELRDLMELSVHQTLPPFKSS